MHIVYVGSLICSAQYKGIVVLVSERFSKEQVNELLKSGCKLGQGYYFAKPLEEEEARKRFDKTDKN